MQISRRQLLHFSGLTMGSFAVSLFAQGYRASGVATARSLIRKSDSSHIKAKMFQPLTGEGFKLQTSDGQAISVTLIEVEEYDYSPKMETFNLVFHSQERETLEQGTYRVSHSKLGEMNLFMVPSPSKRSGQDYVVTTNHYIG